MRTPAIDTAQIEAMVARLRSVATRAAPVGAAAAGATASAQAATRPDFAGELKASLARVSDAQHTARQAGERFALGDENVHLSDVMVASQKASIALQATVQVRNKLVSAYHEIMNMQV